MPLDTHVRCLMVFQLILVLSSARAAIADGEVQWLVLFFAPVTLVLQWQSVRRPRVEVLTALIWWTRVIVMLAAMLLALNVVLLEFGEDLRGGAGDDDAAGDGDDAAAAMTAAVKAHGWLRAGSDSASGSGSAAGGGGGGGEDDDDDEVAERRMAVARMLFILWFHMYTLHVYTLYRVLVRKRSGRRLVPQVPSMATTGYVSSVASSATTQGVMPHAPIVLESMPRTPPTRSGSRVSPL